MITWQNLTERERYLVLVASSLAIVVGLYLLLLRPLGGYVESSARELARAENIYRTVASGAAEIEAAGKVSANAQRSDKTLRLAVARVARENGVQISRIQPGENASLTVWIEGVGSQQLYRWLQQLVTENSVSPVKLNAQKSRVDGMLRVQAQFKE